MVMFVALYFLQRANSRMEICHWCDVCAVAHFIGCLMLYSQDTRIFAMAWIIRGGGESTVKKIRV